jgi:hypothetical protein
MVAAGEDSRAGTATAIRTESQIFFVNRKCFLLGQDRRGTNQPRRNYFSFLSRFLALICRISSSLWASSFSRPSSVGL